jgi:CRISPR-associated protein Cmr2
MELESRFDLNNSSKIFEITRKDYNNPPDGKVNPVAKLQYQAQRLKNEIKQNELTFKSIPEIALASVINKHDFNDNNFNQDDDIEKYDAFYQQFENDENFKQHHKYFAVISADGDSMGSTIRSIYNKDPNEIVNFSENIYKYISEDKNGSKSLVNIFEEYGGMLIYAGGDDILGFAPIFGKNDKSIFDLLEELSKRFQSYLGEQVSLSFGVSINYYKSPMIEAIKHAHTLLYDAKANNTKEKSGSVALSLVKHSGQAYKGVFLLNGNSYISYKKLFIDELSQVIKLPHNLQHSMKKYEAIFIDIFSNIDLERSKQKLDALFENLIKDESHSQDAKEALDRLKEYISIAQPKDKDSFELLLTQLAIIKFLRGDR